MRRNRANQQRRHLSGRQVAEPTLIRQCAMPQQLGEHAQSLVGETLVDQRFLSASARAYREKEHVVLTVDTAKLLAKYEAEATPPPINSGSTVHTPQPRDGKHSVADKLPVH